MKIPSIDEVRTLCEEEGLTDISPEEFILICNKRHWHTTTGQEMKDWKVSIRNMNLYNRTHRDKSSGNISVQGDDNNYVPPTFEEVSAFIASEGYNVDAQRFIDYYGARKWRFQNGDLIIDWKKVVRHWEKNATKLKEKGDSTPIIPSNNDPFNPEGKSTDELTIARAVTLREDLGLRSLYLIDDTLCDAVAREKVLMFILLLLADTPPDFIGYRDTDVLENYCKLFCTAFGNASFSPINAIRNYIKAIPYSDFIKTGYWKILSYKAKKKAGFKCVVCDSTENLQAHHKHYDNHGDITKEVDDLVCLCAECHAKIHGKYQKD